MDTTVKQEAVNDIVIQGFHEFLDIATEEGIEDECTVKAYYYLQGLRDTTKDDDETDERWPDGEEVKKQVQDLLLTLAQYRNAKVRKLAENTLRDAQRHFPGMTVPFSPKALMNKVLGRRALLHVMRRERKESTSPEAEIFI